MTNQYLDKQKMLSVLDAHLNDLHAEQYSHELRIMEFNAAGVENIDQVLYAQMSDMVSQYDLRINALKNERSRVDLLPE